MSIIKAEDVVFEYALDEEDAADKYVQPAVDHVSLSVEKGSFIAIIGHNGSGKSTFAKHLNALLVPTRGTLFVNGMNTGEEENLLDIRQSAGMVFQNPDNQIIGSVVDEDVAFGPENMGIPTEDIWTRVMDSLASVNMTDYKDHSPNKLSGGQKQRVAIAGVLAMRPDVIVLDEPTAMLDPVGRKEVISTITELNKKEGVTIILITHYMDEITGADYVYVMDKGKIKLEGSPRDVFSHVEEIKAIGLDVPKATELAYELKKAGMNIKDGILTGEELVEELCR